MPKSTETSVQDELLHPDVALPKLLAQVTPLTDIETVPLTETLNRVLAADLSSNIDLPPFDNSSMDGYAYRFSDLESEGELTLIGNAFAGHPFTAGYQTKSCVRIMTGAPLPIGYDTVQMQEKTHANADKITITPCKNQGDNVRKQGEELLAGTCVLTAGTTIGAAEMGVMATIGIDKLPVKRKVNVAFFSTGDELSPVGTTLAQGQIYDSNRYTIQGLLAKMNVNWIDLGVIADDPDAIRHAFRQAAAQADMVITSGGVSVGDADFTKQVLDEEGQISFWRVAMKPGKPFAMGHIGNAIFCGLPGNPVSSMVTFYKLVLPLLDKLQGIAPQAPLTVKAKLTTPIKKHPGRVEYQRGILTHNENGELSVAVTGSQGSGMLTSMSVANCFIVLPQYQGDLESGTDVIVEPFNRALS